MRVCGEGQALCDNVKDTVLSAIGLFAGLKSPKSDRRYQQQTQNVSV